MIDILKHAKNISHLKIAHCILIGNNSILTASKTLQHRLTHLSLPGLPRVTDFAIFQLAASCPNILHLNVSDCPKITDMSLCAILSSCKGLIYLNACRLNDTLNPRIPSGYTITSHLTTYLSQYKSALNTLYVGGCWLNEQDFAQLLTNVQCCKLNILGICLNQINGKMLDHIISYCKRISSSNIKVNY